MKINKTSIKYKHILGFLIKGGNITVTSRSVNDSFLRLNLYSHEQRLNAEISHSLPPQFLFSYIFLKCISYVEVREITIRKRKFLVPFLLQFSRRLFLTFKWLRQILATKTPRHSTQHKLELELKRICLFNTSLLLKNKQLNEAQAIANRANNHFRW